MIEREGEDPIVCDAGTGLRFYGLDLGSEQFNGTMLVSHLHWDHIQGLPFFPQILNAGSKAHLIGPPQPDMSFREALRNFVKPPYFPVGLDALRTTLDAVLRSPRPPDVAPDAANTTTAPFATTELDALVGDLGDREIVADLVMTFLGELDARRIAISGADHVTAARQAHTLKSSAALLGAHALAAACAAVEHDPDAQRNLTPLIDSTRADLQAWLDNQPTAQGGVQ